MLDDHQNNDDDDQDAQDDGMSACVLCICSYVTSYSQNVHHLHTNNWENCS